jgi:hypothetical protein
VRAETSVAFLVGYNYGRLVTLEVARNNAASNAYKEVLTRAS